MIRVFIPKDGRFKFESQIFIEYDFGVSSIFIQHSADGTLKREDNQEKVLKLLEFAQDNHYEIPQKCGIKGCGNVLYSDYDLYNLGKEQYCQLKSGLCRTHYIENFS